MFPSIDFFYEKILDFLTNEEAGDSQRSTVNRQTNDQE